MGALIDVTRVAERVSYRGCIPQKTVEQTWISLSFTSHAYTTGQRTLWNHLNSQIIKIN